LKPIGRGKTQKGPVNHPIPHIVIKTSPPINPLLNLLWKMGVAEDDNLKPFQKLLMGKRSEGRGRSGLPFVMIFLITHIAQLLGNLPRNPWTGKMDETIGQRVLKNSSEGPVTPLFWVRSISMGDEGPVSFQLLFTPVRIDLDLHPELF